MVAAYLDVLPHGRPDDTRRALVMVARLTHRSGEIPAHWLALLNLPDAEIAEVLRIVRVALALLD